jgi:hypothetical protein
MAKSFLEFISQSKPTPAWEQPVPISAPPQPLGPAAPTPAQFDSMARMDSGGQTPMELGALEIERAMAQGGRNFFNLNAGAIPLQNPDGSYQAMPESSMSGQVSMTQYGKDMVAARQANEAKAEQSRIQNQGGYNPLGISTRPTETPQAILDMGQAVKTAFTPAWKQKQQAESPATETMINPFTAPYQDGSVPTVQQTPVMGSETAETTETAETAETATRVLDPLSDEAILARRAAREAQARGAPTTMGVEATQQYLESRFGAPTVSGVLSSPEGLGMRTDAQGRMIDPTVDRTAFEQASAEREARALAQAQGFGQGVSDRERRGTGEMSMAEAVRMAQGDRDRARQMIELQRQGRDPMTGQLPSSKTDAGMTPYQEATLANKERDFNYKLMQDAYAQKVKSGEEREADIAAYKTVTEQATRLRTLAEEAIGLTTEGATTGIGGSLLKMIPGTKANELKEVLAIVQSDVALNRLADLKATGATLGQISEKELDMLQNSFDALKQNLRGERLRSALVNYTKQLDNIETKIEAKFKEKYREPQTPSGGGKTKRGDVNYEGSEYEIL